MMDIAKRASVVIVNYNGMKDLEACLTSVLQAVHQTDEVLVIDNASNDGSPDYVELAFPSVRVIRNRENVGFGQANNVGSRESSGKYLAFLNPDTKVEPEWLDALLAILEGDSTIGLATSKILQMDRPDRISGCGNEVHCSGLALGRGMGMDQAIFSEVEEVAAISGAAFAVRRDVFDSMGGFDGEFFMYVEDTDLSFRARLAGHRIVHVPESVVYHDYALHFGPHKIFYQERNRYLMLLKNLRWPTLMLLLPVLLLTEMVTWGFVLLRDRNHLTSKLSAYRWVVTHWQHIMEKRRQVQRVRRARDRDLLERCSPRLAYEQTGESAVTKLAHLFFDPLFFLGHRLALLSIRW